MMADKEEEEIIGHISFDIAHLSFALTSITGHPTLS